MQKESEFNTVVKNSIINCDGFAHKISDIGQIQHGTLPFDIFGCCKNKMIVCESKFYKEPQAFNFKRLEYHQIKSLIQVYESFSDPDRICALFIIGMRFGRNDTRVFWWKNEDLYYIQRRKSSNKSIYKKEFLEMDKYIKIKNNSFDFMEILN